MAYYKCTQCNQIFEASEGVPSTNCPHCGTLQLLPGNDQSAASENTGYDAQNDYKQNDNGQQSGGYGYDPSRTQLIDDREAVQKPVSIGNSGGEQNSSYDFAAPSYSDTAVTKQKSHKGLFIGFGAGILVLVVAIVVVLIIMLNQSDSAMICAGYFNSVGLKDDGTVIATSITDSDFDYGQSNVQSWTDIKQIAAGGVHTVGLKKDGTVVSTSITDSEYDFGQTQVSGWTDITAVAAGLSHTVGLKKDGTVVVAGSSDETECDVSGWSDITAIAAGNGYTLGLKKDGTVLCTLTEDESDYVADIRQWTNVAALSGCSNHILALKKDGTVVATGYDGYGALEVGSWTDIVSVSAGYAHSIGLKKDGTVVVTAITDSDYNIGQDKITDWKLK